MWQHHHTHLCFSVTMAIGLSAVLHPLPPPPNTVVPARVLLICQSVGLIIIFSNCFLQVHTYIDAFAHDFIIKKGYRIWQFDPHFSCCSSPPFPKEQTKNTCFFEGQINSKLANQECLQSSLHVCLSHFEWSTLDYPTKTLGVNWVRGEARGEREGTTPWSCQNCNLISPHHCSPEMGPINLPFCLSFSFFRCTLTHLLMISLQNW